MERSHWFGSRWIASLPGTSLPLASEPVKRFETLSVHEFCATSSLATGGLTYATFGNQDAVGGRCRNRMEGDARVSVDVVAVLEELDAGCPGVLDGAEAVRGRRAVLQGLERCLGIWIVVGYVRATVAAGHSEVDHQLGHRLGAHGRAPVGVDGEVVPVQPLGEDGIVDEVSGQLG